MEQIPINEILSDYQIKNIEIFSQYLINIWKDLSYSSRDKTKGIEKVIFNNYYDLPGIINERLFMVFDQDRNGYLSLQEFLEGMKVLFTGKLQSLLIFIFKLYDFDNDGKINKEDVRTILSYVPNQTKTRFSKEKLQYEQRNFNDRVNSQNELFDILNLSFHSKNTLTQTEFNNIIENSNSDIFIFILAFLLENKPFNENTIQMFERKKDKYENTICHNNEENHENHYLNVINSNSTQQNVCSISNENSIFPTSKISVPVSIDSTFISHGFKLKVKKKSSIKEVTKCLNLYSVNQKKSDKLLIPSKFLIDNSIEEEKNKEERETKKQEDLFIQKKIKNTLSNLRINKEEDCKFKFSHKVLNHPQVLINDSSEEEQDTNSESPTFADYEGFIYKQNENKKFKKLYFKLLGKDLYYFKRKENTEQSGFHNLSGVFLKIENPIEDDNKKYFAFSIQFPQKNRTYYIDNEKDFHIWIHKLSKAINYKNYLKQYQIVSILGKGEFSKVYYATHKMTGREVVIKITIKSKMNECDLNLIKTEINILKICQHPNIIKLYDYFEDAEHQYIVMEYCKGGSLAQYVEKRGGNLSEQRVAEIIHKISMGIYYMNTYGIIHRDLKPENILMTDNTENADVKIIDFGLGKIVGPNERCNEPLGTLLYVAPEVLKYTTYDKSVDIWSLGVITYNLLSGTLPFYEEDSKELVRQIMNEPVSFPEGTWNNFSKEATHFVKGLLTKTPEKRLKITEILEHEWLQKFCKASKERTHIHKNSKSFFMKFSTEN